MSHSAADSRSRNVRQLVLVGMFAVCRIGPARGQSNPECAGVGAGNPAPIAERELNVCNAAVDGAHLFTPVVGVLMSGGSPFLGATGGLGGFPHSGLTIRVNVTGIVIPDLSYSGDGTTVGKAETVPAPVPLVEGAFGVYRGIGGGTLALDALASAQLIPTSIIKDFQVDVNARRIGSIAVGLGFGGRLTLVGEGDGVPAVAISVMHRSIPRIGVGDVFSGDQFGFQTGMGATNYRLTAGKELGLLAVGAGVGWDQYSGDATVEYRDPISSVEEPPIPVSLTDSRAMGFVDGGLATGHFYLIGEVGVQRGKDLHLGTTFVGNDPKANRLFGSVGIRLGI